MFRFRRLRSVSRSYGSKVIFSMCNAVMQTYVIHSKLFTYLPVMTRSKKKLRDIWLAICAGITQCYTQVNLCLCVEIYCKQRTIKLFPLHQTSNGWVYILLEKTHISCRISFDTLYWNIRLLTKQQTNIYTVSIIMSSNAPWGTSTTTAGLRTETWTTDCLNKEQDCCPFGVTLLSSNIINMEKDGRMLLRNINMEWDLYVSRFLLWTRCWTSGCHERKVSKESKSCLLRLFCGGLRKEKLRQQIRHIQ
jgi:hypothetical protein